jgi:hypothetical protein
VSFYDVTYDPEVHGVVSMDQDVAKAGHVAHRRGQRGVDPAGRFQQVKQLSIRAASPSLPSETMCEAVSSAA